MESFVSDRYFKIQSSTFDHLLEQINFCARNGYKLVNFAFGGNNSWYAIMDTFP